MGIENKSEKITRRNQRRGPKDLVLDLLDQFQNLKLTLKITVTVEFFLKMYKRVIGTTK